MSAKGQADTCQPLISYNKSLIGRCEQVLSDLSDIRAHGRDTLQQVESYSSDAQV